MLPGEGIEGGQLHPPATDLLLLIVRVARTFLGALEEAADIGSDVRHAEHVEVEQVSDRVPHVVKRPVVVSEPVTGPLAGTRVRGPGEQELSLVPQVG